MGETIMNDMPERARLVFCHQVNKRYAELGIEVHFDNDLMVITNKGKYDGLFGFDHDEGFTSNIFTKGDGSITMFRPAKKIATKDTNDGIDVFGTEGGVAFDHDEGIIAFDHDEGIIAFDHYEGIIHFDHSNKRTIIQFDHDEGQFAFDHDEGMVAFDHDEGRTGKTCDVKTKHTEFDHDEGRATCQFNVEIQQ